MLDLSIITVSHGHEKEIKRLLKSIKDKNWRVSFEIILIDNLPPHRAAEIARKIYPDVRIFKNSRPKGFAHNVNLGMKFSKGRFIFLLNPDIIVLNGLFDNVVEFMDSHPDIGIAAPRLLNLDGTRQVSARKFPNLPVMIFRGLGLDRFFKNLKLNRDYELRDLDSENGYLSVDWVTGAAMVIRRQAINEVGKFDEKRFHLYFEDVDMCYRMWKAGWKVVYFSNAKAIHEWKRRSAKNPFSIYKFYHVVSGLKFFKKYGLDLKNPREGKR